MTPSACLVSFVMQGPTHLDYCREVLSRQRHGRAAVVRGRPLSHDLAGLDPVCRSNGLECPDLGDTDKHLEVQPVSVSGGPDGHRTYVLRWSSSAPSNAAS